LIASAAGEPITTVALADEVDPSNAPRPSNESERQLFRQLYETLVSVDCKGGVVPGLAVSWTLDADGRTWIVTLREAAQFTDGTPVTAADVLTAWRRDGSGDSLHPRVSRLVESIVRVADRTLAIRLHSPRIDMPLALAHPDLAVSKIAADSPWPLGTRGAWIESHAGAIPVAASSAISMTRDRLPAVRFLVASGDLRDLLDRGVDIMLTRDPATLDYAATLPQFESVPLAWQRTYVLLTPGRSRTAPSLPAEARQTLADDAVRGEARGAQGPFWWQTSGDCGVAAPSTLGNRPPIPRIVYEAADAVARDLAERLVGVAGATAALDAILPVRPGQTFQRARGLTAAALAVSVRRGADAGYIIPLDNRPPDPCRGLRALQESAPWLEPAAIVPLVETRLQAIVRRGVTGVTVEWDGGLLIAGPAMR
jgi:hypothetical protein